MIDKACATCGIPIRVKNHRVRPANYCSRPCYHIGETGKPGRAITEEEKRNLSQLRLGKKRPVISGSKHWNWKGGVDKGTWWTPEYKRWRVSVFERDNYTCVLCGDNRGGNLEADHIKPRYTHPELTFDTANGRTLCKPCHKQTDTWGRKVYTYKNKEVEATI